MKLRNKNIKKIDLVVPALAILYVAALLFLKYHFNEISLKHIRLDYIGNILNILFALVLIAGSVFLSFGKKPIPNKKRVFLIAVLSVSILLLLAALLINELGFIESDKFLFNTPLRKIYTGVLMAGSFFLHIYSLVYVWGLVFEAESLFELRSAVRGALVILMILVFSTFFVWNVRAFSESNIENRKFEYGFIPGAAVYSKGKPSPIFEKRIRKGFELFEKGIVKKLIVTGGNAPGEITEAEAAKKYLSNLGVDKKKITVETRTSTTTEQIRYLSRDHLFKASEEPVLIISDGFHLSRIIQISIFYDIKTVGVSSDYSLSFEKTIFYRTRESIALFLFWLLGI